jgi:hypothetical protein
MSTSGPVKRPRTPDDFADLDSENIDPSVYASPSKKSKGLEGSAIKPKSQFVLKSVQSPIVTRPIATPKRLSVSTKITPSSAPAPAGRSPKSKRAGILSRRRVSSSPFTRIDPPSGLSDTSNGLPFSIDAALSGTVPSYAPTPKPTIASTLEESVPGNWLFEIHEDTPEEELGNLVQFSTQTLDISDDESKVRERDERGKENIPPSELGLVAPIADIRPATRKDMMTDEARTPLGDLDAREFYAPGCDENSFIIVSEDKDFTEPEKSPFAFNAMKKSETPSPSEATSNLDVWKELLAKVDTPTTADAVEDSSNDIIPNDGPIEIWESESAKGEDVTTEQEATP